jgi:hypothetical protein
MDFIERIFHLTPDHGDGTLETLIVLAVVVVPIVVRALRISLSGTTTADPKSKKYGLVSKAIPSADVRDSA